MSPLPSDPTTSTPNGGLRASRAAAHPTTLIWDLPMVLRVLLQDSPEPSPPDPRVESETEALTRRNQEVLIGGVYRPDPAQVSPMRHRRGPALPGASAKWDENTIKRQDQLNNKCIRPSRAAVSLCAAGRMRGMFGALRKCCPGQQTGDKSSGCGLSPNRQSTSPRHGMDEQSFRGVQSGSGSSSPSSAVSIYCSI